MCIRDRVTSEHIGHQVVTSKIVGRDLLRDPGLHRSLFGDNFSTMISEMCIRDRYMHDYEGALAAFEGYVSQYGSSPEAEHEIAFLRTR